MRETCHLAVTTFFVEPAEFLLASFMSKRKRALRKFIKKNEHFIRAYAMSHSFIEKD